MHSKRHVNAILIGLIGAGALFSAGCVNLMPRAQRVQLGRLQFVAILGLDVETDGKLIGFGVNWFELLRLLSLEGALELGRGQMNYNGDALSKAAQGDIEYSVIRASGRLRVPVALTDDGKLVAYPVIAPGYYRWKQKDCDFEGCTENLFVADFGGGIAYRFVGLEAFTTANGPDFGVRLRFSLPIM